MELKQYFELVRRWAWLLVLGLVLGLAGGFFGSRYQTPIYQASTRLLVIRAPQEKISDTTYLSDQQMVQTYIQLATTQPVLDAVTGQLGYAVDKKQIQVGQIKDTQILQVTVEDPSPQHASDIANLLVQVLIDHNENLQSSRYAETESSLQTQVDQVQTQITSLQSQVEQLSTANVQKQLEDVKAQITPLQDEVNQLQQLIASLTPAYTTDRKTQLAQAQSRLNEIQPLLTLYQQIYSNLVVLGKPVDSGSGSDTRLTQLQSTLDLYQQIYINLLNSLELVKLARLQNTPNIVQIEPAALPGQPVRPRPLQNTLLAGAVGLMLAAGIAFLIEYLDDTLKTPTDVERVLDLPVIGLIAEMQYPDKSSEQVYVARQPRSPVSEAFRSLRTNLEFTSVDNPLHTLLVTSAGPTEGKTTVAANLAASISQGGKRVALLDADMRRPHIHRFMGLSNRVGLSDLFRDNVAISAVSHSVEGLPGLLVITSGSLPPNPTELLGSERMTRLLAALSEQVDIVLIDTPPSLVADAQVLAGKVDGVLLVVQPGHTQADVAASTLELMRRAGTRVVGVVLNRIPRNRAYYYGGYRHYDPYYRGYSAYSGDGARPADEAQVQGAAPPQPESLLRRLAKSPPEEGEQDPSAPAGKS